MNKIRDADDNELTPAPKPASLCDICDMRPGNRTIIAYGTETWVCDICCGDVEASNRACEYTMKVIDQVMDSLFRYERNTTGVDRRHWADKPQENDDV
jgi:hypothetical protein